MCENRLRRDEVVIALLNQHIAMHDESARSGGVAGGAAECSSCQSQSVCSEGDSMTRVSEISSMTRVSPTMSASEPNSLGRVGSGSPGPIDLGQVVPEGYFNTHEIPVKYAWSNSDNHSGRFIARSQSCKTDPKNLKLHFEQSKRALYPKGK